MKTIRVRVKPNAKRAGLEESGDGTWAAQVKAAPIDGKANRELITLVASHFKLRKSQVTIKSGSSARIKLLRLDT